MSIEIKREAEALIPTEWGEFEMIAYSSKVSEYSPDLALVHPDVDVTRPVSVRIHSECITGDLFHSRRCDCGDQLHSAMDYLSKNKGVLIYLRQEGRGIGIVNKLHAYNKQDEGMDTIEANIALGLEIDYRSYAKAIAILEDLDISSIKILTNNPEKIEAFDDSDIEVVDRVSLEVKANSMNVNYLKTKKDSLGHMLDM
jgi:GTP cyclohydrolase II